MAKQFHHNYLDKESQPLNARQRLFVQEYLVDLNASRAAIRAGYSPKTAMKWSCSMMKMPNIRKAVAAAIEARHQRVQVDQDRVIQEIARVAFADTTQVVNVRSGRVNIVETDLLPEDTRRAIAEIHETVSASGCSLRVRLHDKIKALELLGRHLGLFVDRQEISGPGGKVLTFAQLAEAAAKDDDDGGEE